MISTFKMIEFINKSLQIRPHAFGFAGEAYMERRPWSAEQFEVIGRYIFVYQNTCVNRRMLYYSNSFADAVMILQQAYRDYGFIQRSQLDQDMKRYVLYTVVEYVIHAVCKLLHVCFENRMLRNRFYSTLKGELQSYMDTQVELMFSDTLPDFPAMQSALYQDISDFFIDGGAPVLREHVEYDHKLLLVCAYIFYYDIIDENQLLLCPLLGAAQVPPFIQSLERYFGRSVHESRSIEYDFVKYSTYDISEALTLDEQALELVQNHSQCSNVLLLDESLGTGNTLFAIKSILVSFFRDVKTGAVEFRWDKKIVFNQDREWFDIHNIDYITPLTYRHYLLLENHMAGLKRNVVNPSPYVPFMIYEDHDFECYMSGQTLDDEKKESMNVFFVKARQIKEVFYL